MFPTMSAVFPELESILQFMLIFPREIIGLLTLRTFQFYHVVLRHKNSAKTISTSLPSGEKNVKFPYVHACCGR